MQPEPQSLEEYTRWFHANQRVSGYGVEGTTMHMPCPFCTSIDWGVWPVLDSEEAMQINRTCQDCGRSGKIIFLVNTPDEKRFEFVQTAGPDAPEWLTPAPRRING